MRLTYTQTALGAALLATTMLAPAQDKSARISDGVVKIGVLTDFQSVYSDIGGAGNVEATKMAI